MSQRHQAANHIFNYFNLDEGDAQTMARPSRRPPDPSSSSESGTPAAIISETLLSLLEPLRSSHLFIIQPKVDRSLILPQSCFLLRNPTTHKVSNDKRNLVFKATKQNKVIKLCNLRKRKVLTVELPSSTCTSLLASNTEALISLQDGLLRARVSKYFGGQDEDQPSYSVTKATSEESDPEDDELFSIETLSSHHHHSHSSKKALMALELNIFKPSGKLVGRIASKSGLSLMLHVGEGVTLLDKALLIGVVIAMDLLKGGNSNRKTRPENDYHQLNDNE